MPERRKDRLREIRAKMEAHTRVYPIRITPRHRVSGPHRYNGHPVEVPSPSPDAAACVGPECESCHGRILRGSGELIAGRWCGQCAPPAA
jgi:hypothetical protein